jgi:hypothetical protein
MGKASETMSMQIGFHLTLSGDSGVEITTLWQGNWCFELVGALLV